MYQLKGGQRLKKLKKVWSDFILNEALQHASTAVSHAKEAMYICHSALEYAQRLMKHYVQVQDEGKV